MKEYVKMHKQILKTYVKIHEKISRNKKHSNINIYIYIKKKKYIKIYKNISGGAQF